MQSWLGTSCRSRSVLTVYQEIRWLLVWWGQRRWRGASHPCTGRTLCSGSSPTLRQDYRLSQAWKILFPGQLNNIWWFINQIFFFIVTVNWCVSLCDLSTNWTRFTHVLVSVGEGGGSKKWRNCYRRRCWRSLLMMKIIWDCCCWWCFWISLLDLSHLFQVVHHRLESRLFLGKLRLQLFNNLNLNLGLSSASVIKNMASETENMKKGYKRKISKDQRRKGEGGGHPALFI